MSKKIPESMLYELLKDKALEELNETGVNPMTGTFVAPEFVLQPPPAVEDPLTTEDSDLQPEAPVATFVGTLESCLRWNDTSTLSRDQNYDQDWAFPGYPRVSQFVLTVLATSFPMAGMASTPPEAFD